MELIFATQNRNKVNEISRLLGDPFVLKGLQDLGFTEEIPEDHDTLEENASQKAWHIYNLFGQACFADDTGLEIFALDGRPGVYSARYSRIGSPVFPEMEPAPGNIRKVLLEMERIKERSAQFRTIISLVLEGKEYRFEGIVKGEITLTPSGTEGFGYDPIFRPEGYGETFAEMDLSRKNQISHRARAMQGLIDFLKEK